MKKLKTITKLIVSILGTIILSISTFIFIGAIQQKLFLPKEYIMWIFKSPFSILVFIYEVYIIFGFFFIFNKEYKHFILWVSNLKNSFIKRHKIVLLSTFVAFNIVILYFILFDVAVITNNKIIDYTFLTPQGKEYSYNDIVKIDTGVYGKKLYLPFTHTKGDFYYIIQMRDGTKIDLTEMGGPKNDEDPRFIIEKLDIEYVNMGIAKVSSMDNFKYCTQNLDKIYTDKIKKIILNIK